MLINTSGIVIGYFLSLIRDRYRAEQEANLEFENRFVNDPLPQLDYYDQKDAYRHTYTAARLVQMGYPKELVFYKGIVSIVSIYKFGRNIMKEFIKNNKNTYQRASESNLSKKLDYEKKLRAILILVLMPTFLALAMIVDIKLGVSEYITATIGGLLAITISVVLASKKANKKYKGK